MVAIMKYECGLKFTGIICESKEVALKYIEGSNPRAYTVIPVHCVTAEMIKEGAHIRKDK